MQLVRPLGFTTLALCLSGCYGATLERVEGQLDAARRETQVLRESFQAQRRSLRTLQDRLELLEDRAEARALHGGSTAPRPLPVVKLSPAAPSPAPEEDPVVTITQSDVDGPRRRRGPSGPVPPPANAANAGNIGVVPVAASPLPPRGRGEAPTPAPAPVVDDGLGDTAPMDQALMAYRRARGLYDRGSVTAAVAALDDFVQRYPRHDFADNALHLLGTARFEQARYPAALKAFRAVVEQHPTGNKVADALLMIGRTQMKLGQPAEGRETLARLMALFPGGPAAREASRVLESTGRM